MSGPEREFSGLARHRSASSLAPNSRTKLAGDPEAGGVGAGRISRPATSAMKGSRQASFSGLPRADSRRRGRQRDRFDLGKSWTAASSGSSLPPPPVFGQDAKVVRFQKEGPRFQNMEARFIDRKQVKQSSYGTHSPGPVYSPPSEFGALPPLPQTHFLMRTSPLLKLGIGTAAEVHIKQKRRGKTLAATTKAR